MHLSGVFFFKIEREVGIGRRVGLGANGRGEERNGEPLVLLLSLCKLQGLIGKWGDTTPPFLVRG